MTSVFECVVGLGFWTDILDISLRIIFKNLIPSLLDLKETIFSPGVAHNLRDGAVRRQGKSGMSKLWLRTVYPNNGRRYMYALLIEDLKTCH